jgi:hypothetical protein
MFTIDLSIKLKPRESNKVSWQREIRVSSLDKRAEIVKNANVMFLYA